MGRGDRAIPQKAPPPVAPRAVGARDSPGGRARGRKKGRRSASTKRRGRGASRFPRGSARERGSEMEKPPVLLQGGQRRAPCPRRTPANGRRGQRNPDGTRARSEPRASGYRKNRSSDERAWRSGPGARNRRASETTA